MAPKTYGVAQDQPVDVDIHSAHSNNESDALLGNDATPRIQKREGNGTLHSSVGNLANTIIGSGMLTFPLAMATTGIIPGMITCLFSGCVASFGLYLLSLCAVKAPHRRASFFAIAELTFPRAAVFFDAAIAIKCFGVSIRARFHMVVRTSYLIIVKTLMPNVVAALYHDLTSPDTNPPDWALSGRIWISLLMLILVPLCFLRRLDSLRHTSYIALFSVAYLVVIVVVCYFFPLKGTQPRGEVHLIKFTPSFVSTFPVQVFAYTCAQNLFPIFNEIHKNTQPRMNIVIGTSIGGAALIYEIISIFGYLTFGSKVGANIIAMYPSTSLFIAVGQLAIAVLVLFSYPLQVHPCRNCLDKVFHAGHVLPAKTGTLEESEEEEVEDEHSESPDMSPLKHTLLTLGIIISGFTIAYFVDDLQMDHLDHFNPNAEESPRHPSSPPPTAQTTQMTITNAEASTQADIAQPAALAASASAPEIQGARSLNASSVPFSPSLDSGLLQSRNSSAEALQNNTAPSERSRSSSPSETDVNPIVEALQGKDRIWLLKLADMMEGLINDRSPSRRVAELVPAEEVAQPAFKIMRRTAPDRRTRQTSQPGSVTGDDADISDLDPSETSSVTGGGKRHLTIEEREAAYNEARSRIFMGFEPKKENSANSSTLSLTSGSAGRSSAGDGDDAASSAATESEWSGPVTRDRRDGKRGGSSRRSNQGSYNASASGSSRNSRATSPSFTFPSLYDPHGNNYEPTFGPHAPQQQYPSYYYPYPPQGPSQPYLTPYNYGYAPYGYSPPNQPSPHHSDPVTPAGGEQGYAAQSPPAMMYQPSPYMWHPPPPPQQGQSLPQATSPANTNPNLPMVPAPSQSPPTQMPPPPPPNMMNYQGYFAPGYPPAPYPMPPYYHPPGQQMPPPAQPHPAPPGPPFYPEGQHPDPRFNNGNGMDNHSRTSSRNSNGHGQNNGNGRRGPAPQRRGAWSYGPGVSVGGMNASLPSAPDNTGPRLGNRRISNGSQSTGNRTPGDEASSVTSSTSSSSRQTYTSTSSKHPLPARPDWAVGLKAQPTLSGPRHHDHSNANSRTMSPARLPGHLPGPPYQQTQMQSPLQSPPQSQNPILQATDFPPLSSAPEKKTPVLGGAWTNSSGIRSALRAGSTSGGAGLGMSPRPDGLDGPSPKAGEDADARGQNASMSDGDELAATAGYRSEPSATAGLADRLSEMTLTGNGPDAALTATSSNEALSVAAGGVS
ncbi:hypothetical protein EIP86_004610 [Pleurotus ostreatoroseus]|nr:hypothetical protein EIP86_004610 [Pleurotus ostreatoroseus]